MTRRKSTPERLQAAAWKIIRDEGLRAATSRRITGIAKTHLESITYHFGSKDALLAQVIVDQLARWSEPLTGALRENADDAEMQVAAMRAIQSFVQGGDDMRGLVRALMASDRLPGVRDAVAAWLADFRALVSRVVADQQAAGTVSAAVVPDAMAGVFTAFAIGVVAQSSIDDAPPPTDALVAQFLLLLSESRPRPASR